MRQWVLSFPFQLRFLFASRPEIMGWVLGIVYRVIATHLVKKAGHTHQVAKTGAVTLIQRFGSALNLNVHFHMLFLDGVYVEQSHGSARFRWVKAPTSPELTQLTHTIAHRVGRYLERQGLLERDVENSYLASDAVDDDPMTPLLGHSITLLSSEDIAATAVAELRRRNMIRPEQMPYKNPMGQVYDVGQFEKMLDQGLALADWSGYAARREASRQRGKLRGRGIAKRLWSNPKRRRL